MANLVFAPTVRTQWNRDVKGLIPEIAVLLYRMHMTLEKLEILSDDKTFDCRRLEFFDGCEPDELEPYAEGFDTAREMVMDLFDSSIRYLLDPDNDSSYSIDNSRPHYIAVWEEDPFDTAVYVISLLHVTEAIFENTEVEPAMKAYGDVASEFAREAVAGREYLRPIFYGRDSKVVKEV
jgi:hypothetical protein